MYILIFVVTFMSTVQGPSNSQLTTATIQQQHGSKDRCEAALKQLRLNIEGTGSQVRIAQCTQM
jgi:superoxide dismutase